MDRPDRLIAGLTARQTLILATAGLGLWVLWQAARHVVPPFVYAAAASPLAVTAAALALGRRDGLPLDRWLLAAVRHARTPRRQVHAPEGIRTAPDILPSHVGAGPVPAPAAPVADGIGPDGTVHLGRDGSCVLARVSTVNFALRTPAEQDGLVAAYASWLNSLDAPVQILVRATRLDLTPTITALRQHAPALPHPALEAAALEHAGFLADLATGRDLLHRHVLLVHTSHDPAGPQQLRRRTDHAARQLAAADLTVTHLDGPAATALLHDACNPDTPPAREPAPDGRNHAAGHDQYAAGGPDGERAPGLAPVRGPAHATTAHATTAHATTAHATTALALRHRGWALPAHAAAHPDEEPADPWGEL